MTASDNVFPGSLAQKDGGNVMGDQLPGLGNGQALAVLFSRMPLQRAFLLGNDDINEW